ncbi:hypothetical protein ACLOJK_019335 [Asimina triloba]
MLSRVNGVGWMEGEGEEGDSVSSWNRDADDKADDLSLSTFKSMLDVDDWNACYFDPSHHSSPVASAFHMLKDIPFPPPNNPPPSSQDALLLQHPLESSSSSSPSSIFSLDASRPPPPFAPSKNCLSSLLNVVCNNPFDADFDLACDAAMFPPLPAAMQSNSPVLMNRGAVVLPGFNSLGSNGQVGVNDFASKGQFHTNRLLPLPENAGFNLGIPSFGGFSGNLGGPLFANRPKVLRPLEVSPPVGEQPTLFQKRAALRQNSAAAASEKAGNSGGSVRITPQVGVRKEVEEEAEKWRKYIEKNEVDEASVDASGLNYDSDEVAAENANKGDESGKNGDQKGKKKGLPAKNLMAERRRRKKLNDRLYMLRSVVPKISKVNMSTFPCLYSCHCCSRRLLASILGDAIEYLKELLQRINDLHNELESTPAGSSLPSNANFHPLTPTLPTLPCRVKEELCSSSLPSPNNQTAKVEVRVREGRAVDLHMFCARKPGLLLSTMRALDSLGLDIQQAVISCFNGFALDVFRAEMPKWPMYNARKAQTCYQMKSKKYSYTLQASTVLCSFNK